MTERRVGRAARGGRGSGQSTGCGGAFGLVKAAAEGAVALAARDRGLPRGVARHRGEALKKSRGDRRRARELGGAGEKHLRGAGELREIVRRKADAPLRQIEAERMAHRPVEPGIGARIGRPDALDEAADDDAIDVGQPRFERAVDAHAAFRRAGPAHHAIADDDAEQLHIVGRLDHERLRLLGDVGKGGVERHAVGAGEGGGHVVGVEARR